MANAVDFILDGLSEYLELERELGVRTVEIDRSLLVNVAVAQGEDALPTKRRISVAVAQGEDATPTLRRINVAGAQGNVAGASSPRIDDGITFLHHAALSPRAVEMMAKIIDAMKLTAETAPIVFTGDLPSSRILVVLGGLALKKWFPERQKGAPGVWFTLDDGREVLITYTPEYFLRFAAITPAVEKMKRDMWLSLKTVMHKLKATQQ